MKNLMLKLFLLFIISDAGLLQAGQPAATVGSVTSHGGTVTQGSSTVFVSGAPISRVGDYASCPLFLPTIPPTPHTGGTIISGSATVFINGLPAAKTSSLVQESAGAISEIATGSTTVLIGN